MYVYMYSFIRAVPIGGEGDPLHARRHPRFVKEEASRVHNQRHARARNHVGVARCGGDGDEHAYPGAGLVGDQSGEPQNNARVQPDAYHGQREHEKDAGADHLRHQLGQGFAQEVRLNGVGAGALLLGQHTHLARKTEEVEVHGPPAHVRQHVENKPEHGALARRLSVRPGAEGVEEDGARDEPHHHTQQQLRLGEEGAPRLLDLPLHQHHCLLEEGGGRRARRRATTRGSCRARRHLTHRSEAGRTALLPDREQLRRRGLRSE
mmetsp:Transcript_21916/g.51002  ORF Transcript_21916/g.51002 Transcript_21916/m.51002 type:complete len:264 (+) Transcript_21916:531-1322(+)